MRSVDPERDIDKLSRYSRIMSNSKRRIGIILLVVAALMGALTVPTNKRLGILMLFLAILAAGHAFLASGLRENGQTKPERLIGERSHD